MSNVPAVRNETGKTPHELTQLVSFELEGEEYGIDVLAVREIIRMPAITKMPDAPDYVDGIINLRGLVVPIVSLRKRFGLPEQDRDSHSRILVVEGNNTITGYVVDAVAEVLRISAAEIQPPPEIIQGNSVRDSIVGVINHGERLLIVLDPGCLLSPEESEGFKTLE